MPNDAAPSRLAMVPTGFLVMVTALAIDQATKYWILVNLWPPYGDALTLLPFLNLRLGFNTGVSFGLFAESAAQAVWFLVAIKVLAVALLGVWLWRSAEPTEAAALGSIIGGAIGNGLDRVRHGAVVDFIDAHVAGWHWPTFNLADVAIVCGALALVLTSLRPEGDAKQP